jgi:Ca2+-binding RTX toxin-like protein
MAEHVIKKDQTATVKIEESNSEWVLAKNVILSGSPAFGNDTYDNVTLSVSGEIATSGNGIYFSTAMPGASTDGASVTLTQSGRINAEFFGILISGDDAAIKNSGQIKTQTAEAIYLDGDNVSVVNKGLLRAADAPAIGLTGTEVFSIRNTGRIVAGADDVAISGQDVADGRIVNLKSGVIDGAISFDDFNAVNGSVEITNKGKIAEGAGANNAGISFEDGNDRLVNRGLIGGDVNFGGGDDYGDFRKGDLGGAFVLGGDGDDVFVISDTSTKIFEFGNGGSDTIKTTVSYALGNLTWDDIEILQAIGKKNISLAGNDEGNVLKGNAGNNAMSGGAGNDILAGFGGKDTLSGDMGADHFYFYEKGGIDTITDFTPGEDVIHIVQVSGIDDFGDLQSRMSSVDFDGDKDVDTVIDLGDGSRIRLTDVAKSDLDMSDFSIFPA